MRPDLAAALVGWFLLLILFACVMPLAWIWSLNTLFGLAIPFGFKTWVGALILGSTLFVRSTSPRN